MPPGDPGVISARLPLIGVLLFSGILLPQILGLLTAGYDARTDYISELGATGAPYAAVMNYVGFLPAGLAIMVAIVLLWRSLAPSRMTRLGLVCLSGVAIGYLVAFLFPCDAGCPVQGSTKQMLHNAGGLIEYLGGVIGLFLLYFGSRGADHSGLSRATMIAAYVAAFGVIVLFSGGLEDVLGAAQRLVDYSFFAWFAYAVYTTRSSERHEN